MLKKLFLAMFILSSIPVGITACNKDEKKEDSDKKKKADDDDDKADKKKKSKKDDDSSDDDDSKSKKKKSKKDDDSSDDDDDSKSKKKAKDEDGDSKKKDDSASDDADSVGVKACDDYLARYMKCMPGDDKTKKNAVKQMRDAWKQAATSSAGKDALKTSCKQANDGLDKIPSCK
jgi:hypothetical protein